MTTEAPKTIDTEKALAKLAEAHRLLAEAKLRTEDTGETHRVYRNADTDELRIMTWAEVQPLGSKWIICWQATGGVPPQSKSEV